MRLVLADKELNISEEIHNRRIVLGSNIDIINGVDKSNADKLNATLVETNAISENLQI